MTAAIEVYTPPVTGAASIVAWADAASAAARLVGPLVETEFVPAHFRGQVESATAAVLFGAEVGLTPLQSLQGVYVISGKPAMYARTMLAVTQARGHEVWTEEVTDGKAIVCGKRKGSQHTERVVWTLQRAQKAGYTRNSKYNSDPQAMLLARAQAEVCRRIAADALLGMAYSVEELEDETGTATVSATVEGPRKVKRAALEAVPAPPLDEEPPAEPELPESQEPDGGADPRDAEPTKAQLTKLNILLQEAGFTEREAKLAELSTRVGRELSSSKDLTRAEASSLIDGMTPAEPVA